MTKYHFNSLEDFLISTTFTVDGQIDVGRRAPITVKGREIEAVILFSDIAGFSRRTLELNPAETLIFINHFFTWVSAEALQDTNGIVDKYIGDEIMIVFSKEFGSEDPFEEAVGAARWMSENDVYSFCPHIGIASGKVIVGYVGTPLKYNCSVFGTPVALAARCAGIKPLGEDLVSASIVFPAEDWGNRDFDEVFPPRKLKHMDGHIVEQPHSWELRPARMVKVKNIPDLKVKEIVNRGIYIPEFSAEQVARGSLKSLSEANRYWPSSGT